MVNNHGPISAEQLMRQLENDPEYLARVAERDAALEERQKRLDAEAEPVLQDLSRAGFVVDDISALRYEGVGNKLALPVLLGWLERDTSRELKRLILLALSARWAGPSVLAPLIREFRRVDPGEDDGDGSIRAQILIVVERHADASVVDDLLEILNDERQGSARKFAALTLGKVRSESGRTVPALLQVAQDTTEPNLNIFALIALGMLKEVMAKPLIEAALENPDPWVRKKMKQALTKLP